MTGARASLRSRTGVGSAATLALALLTAGCVLLALAGPKLALAARTDALRKLLDGTSPTAQSLQVSGNWSGFTTALAGAFLSSPQANSLTDGKVTSVTSQLRRDFTIGPLRPAPLQQAWAGLSSDELQVASSFPALHGQGAQLEVMYRSPFTSYTTLVAGQYPGPAPAARAPASAFAPGGSSSPVRVPLNVAVSVETAKRFGLRPGSVIGVGVPNLGVSGQVVLTVTGVVAPKSPGSTFWTADPTAARPALIQPPDATAPSYWIGAVFVSPAEVLALQRALGPRLNVTWQIPLTLGGIRGDQAQQLYGALNRVTTQPPVMPGDLAPAATSLTITTGLQRPLQGFLATTAGLDSLQSLLFASLALTAAVVLLLAGRMVALRREPELTMLRARGASLRQVSWTGLRGALIACVPAAFGAALIAGLAIHGDMPTGSLPWLMAAGVLVVACLGPALAGAWPQRHGVLSPRHGVLSARADSTPWRSRRGRQAARWVAEITACALAIAALVVLREHGTSAADLFTSAGPALVAVPVVLIEQRLYPLALRGALRIAARRRGATAFLALAGATRTALTPALPTFALVLGLTVAAFGGMVRAGIAAGDVTASWLAVGADVSITPGPAQGNGFLAPEVINGAFSPDMVRAIAGVPGVRHVATIYRDAWSLPGGQQATGIAVDPASYAALVAVTPGYWPQVPARLLEPAAGGGTPVLATPDVAAMIGTGPASVRTAEIQPVTIHVAGQLASTPALPGIGSFLIAPASALHGVGPPVYPNVILLTGPDIDQARLAAILGKQLPGAQAAIRSAQLSALTQAPLQHGVFQVFSLAIVASAALGLAVLLLVLALGAASRERTLARLATMGLSSRQRSWLVLLEVGPAVLAAAIAGTACALLLPGTLGPVIDLSVFTGAGTPVSFGPDALSVGLPVAGLAVLAGLALAIEIRAGRRLGIAPRLRGEG